VALQWLYSGSTVALQWLYSGSTMKTNRRLIELMKKIGGFATRFLSNVGLI